MSVPFRGFLKRKRRKIGWELDWRGGGGEEGESKDVTPTGHS